MGKLKNYVEKVLSYDYPIKISQIFDNEYNTLLIYRHGLRFGVCLNKNFYENPESRNAEMLGEVIDLFELEPDIWAYTSKEVKKIYEVCGNMSKRHSLAIKLSEKFKTLKGYKEPAYDLDLAMGLIFDDERMDDLFGVEFSSEYFIAQFNNLNIAENVMNPLSIMLLMEKALMMLSNKEVSKDVINGTYHVNAPEYSELLEELNRISYFDKSDSNVQEFLNRFIDIVFGAYFDNQEYLQQRYRRMQNQLSIDDVIDIL